jgi:hypothetical protein
MTAKNVLILPGYIEQSMLLKGLLARWLRIDDHKDDLIAPADLVEATRLALSGHLAPRIVIQLSSGAVQSVHSSLPDLQLQVVDYDATPEAIANTQGLTPILAPR